MSGDPIRVLIVDDHAVVREGLRTFLELQDGIEVAGEAGDGAEAIELAQRLAPDVILMDLVMPRLDGIGAMRALREHVPHARVIVLTSFLDDERLMPALEAGADGYLLKDVEPAELARAIRTAQSGEAMIAPTVAGRLLRTLAQPRPPAATDGERLTRREREVLELMAEGRSNAAIAARLFVTERAVAKHTASIFAKLDLQPSDDDNRRVLAVLAYLGR